MVLIQKCHRTVTDIGTDPMDGDSVVRPRCEEAIVGSVADASSRGNYQMSEPAGNVIIRCFVS